MTFKRLFTLLTILNFAFACSDKKSDEEIKQLAKRIEKENINSLCECIEGLDLLIQDYMIFIKDHSSNGELVSDEQLIFQKKVMKSELIGIYCREKFGFNIKKLDDIKNCNAVESFKKTMKEAKKKAPIFKRNLEPPPVTLMRPNKYVPPRTQNLEFNEIVITPKK